MQSSTQKKKQGAAKLLELVKNAVAEIKEKSKSSLQPIMTKTSYTGCLGKTSLNKNHWLYTVTERNSHSTRAITNPIFIQYRNVNSTLSENVYIAFGHSIFCSTWQGTNLPLVTASAKHRRRFLSPKATAIANNTAEVWILMQILTVRSYFQSAKGTEVQKS